MPPTKRARSRNTSNTRNFIPHISRLSRAFPRQERLLFADNSWLLSRYVRDSSAWPNYSNPVVALRRAFAEGGRNPLPGKKARKIGLFRPFPGLIDIFSDICYYLTIKYI